MGYIDQIFKSQYNYNMNELLQRLERAKKQISSIKNKVARRDLLKMVKAVDSAMVSADMESVECRRLKKETSRYQELIQQVEKLLLNLEQYITFANLLGG